MTHLHHLILGRNHRLHILLDAIDPLVECSVPVIRLADDHNQLLVVLQLLGGEGDVGGHHLATGNALHMIRIRQLQLGGNGRLQIRAQRVQVTLDVQHGGGPATIVNAAHLEGGHSGGGELVAGGQLPEGIVLQLGEDALAVIRVDAEIVGVLGG